MSFMSYTAILPSGQFISNLRCDQSIRKNSVSTESSIVYPCQWKLLKGYQVLLDYFIGAYDTN